MPAHIPLKDRFWKYVSKTDNCWIWTGKYRVRDYGRIGDRNRKLLAHRASWELHFGEVPTGLHVLHHCDNPSCVNPDHLFLGTHKDNMKDRDIKGRQTRGESFCKSKLKNADIPIIRQMISSGMTLQAVADHFAVRMQTIYAIDKGITWKHII